MTPITFRDRVDLTLICAVSVAALAAIVWIATK